MRGVLSVPGAGPAPGPPPNTWGSRRVPLFHVQGPDALGGMDLVTADGHQVRPQLLGGEVQLAEGLDTVCVEQAGAFFRRMARAAASTGNTAPVSLFTSITLTRMVSPSMASKSASSGRRPVRRASGTPPESPASPAPGRGQDRVVLRRGGDDFPPHPLSGQGRPEEGQVVGLGAAAGKGELLRPGAQTGGHRGPGASTRCRAAKPLVCREEGLPYSSVISSTAAWAASGSTGVVALLSR